MATFRGLVYRLRTDAGLTQRQLARKMGIAKSAVEEMEGRRHPTDARACRKTGCRSGPGLGLGRGRSVPVSCWIR